MHMEASQKRSENPKRQKDPELRYLYFRVETGGGGSDFGGVGCREVSRKCMVNQGCL